MTTILEAAQALDSSFTAADLAAAMALPAGVDIATFNPFAAGADAATAHAVETVFQQVMTATLLVSEAMQGISAIAGSELSSEQASAAALRALTAMIVGSEEDEVDMTDSVQIASLQTFATSELAAQGFDVLDPVVDFVLSRTSDTVMTIASAFNNLTVDDFTSGGIAAVSMVKQEAAAELAAMSAAAALHLTDFADLSEFDSSDTLTLNSVDGVSAAIANNGGDTGGNTGSARSSWSLGRLRRCPSQQ